MVQGGECQKAVKKTITRNVHFQPLSYIHVPLEDLRKITNDAFSEPAQGNNP